MKRELNTDFFNRPADIVARELLGNVICVRYKEGNTIKRLIINETEAYMGPHDLACHSSKGKTKRTTVMFGKPGTIYVYLIYGMYSMLNIVTGEKDYPAAVLIRGAGTYDGPGKLTKALCINRSMNGLMHGRKTGLWFENGIPSIRQKDIMTTPRIGVGYAGTWAKKELRFVYCKK